MIPRAAFFDTNILIEYERNVQNSVHAIQNCPERYISKIVWVEFLAGAPQSYEPQIRAFLENNFTVVSPEDEAYEIALALRRDRTPKIKLPDALIYASACEYGVPLITKNSKDFRNSDKNIYVLD